MEDIALASLPRDVDSEAYEGSDASSQSISASELVAQAETFSGVNDDDAHSNTGDTSDEPSILRTITDHAEPSADMQLQKDRLHASLPRTTEEGEEEEGEEEEEDFTIKCVCGFADDDGNTVLCEKCNTWQHIVCYYSSTAHVPDIHDCTDCSPRFIDPRRAVDKQRQQMHRPKVANRNIQSMTAVQGTREAKTTEPSGRTVSSYWSADELQGFENMVPHFGTDFKSFSRYIGTKTPTMIKNHYLRMVERGNLDIEQAAKDADEKKRSKGPEPREYPPHVRSFLPYPAYTHDPSRLHPLLESLSGHYLDHDTGDVPTLAQVSVPNPAVHGSMGEAPGAHGLITPQDAHRSEETKPTSGEAAPFHNERAAGAELYSADHPKGFHSSLRKHTFKKGHTKSRVACFSCKRRRMACNGEHPTCSHCTKANLRCEYPADIVRSADRSSQHPQDKIQSDPLAPAPTTSDPTIHNASRYSGDTGTSTSDYHAGPPSVTTDNRPRPVVLNATPAEDSQTNAVLPATSDDVFRLASDTIEALRSGHSIIEPLRAISREGQLPSVALESNDDGALTRLSHPPLECPHCKNRFVGRYASLNWQRHMRFFHRKSHIAHPYTCEVCKKSFSGPYTLSVHRCEEHHIDADTIKRKEGKTILAADEAQLTMVNHPAGARNAEPGSRDVELNTEKQRGGQLDTVVPGSSDDYNDLLWAARKQPAQAAKRDVVKDTEAISEPGKEGSERDLKRDIDGLGSSRLNPPSNPTVEADAMNNHNTRTMARIDDEEGLQLFDGKDYGEYR